MKYEEIKFQTFEGNFLFIRRIDKDGIVSGIPIDSANSDYQAYQAWLEDQAS